MKEEDSEESIWWIFGRIVLPFGLLFLLLLGFFWIIDNIQDVNELHIQPECENICNSKQEFYLKTKAGFFQNDLCYCQDNKGAINIYPI